MYAGVSSIRDFLDAGESMPATSSKGSAACRLPIVNSEAFVDGGLRKSHWILGFVIFLRCLGLSVFPSEGVWSGLSLPTAKVTKSYGLCKVIVRV